MVTTNSTTTEYQCEAQLPNVTLWNVCRLGRAAPLLQIWPEPVTYTITVTAPINAQLLSTETPRGQPAYALRVTDTHTHSLAKPLRLHTVSHYPLTDLGEVGSRRA